MALQTYRVRRQSPVGVTDLLRVVSAASVTDTTGGVVFDIEVDDSEEEDFLAGLESLGIDLVSINPVTAIEDDFLPAGGGLTPSAHRDLDQLVHDIAEDNFTELTYSGARLTNETVWTDVGKTTKIRETQFSYTGARVTQVVEIQYDAAGLPVETLTSTIAYVFPLGGRVASITEVLT